MGRQDQRDRFPQPNRPHWSSIGQKFSAWAACIRGPPRASRSSSRPRRAASRFNAHEQAALEITGDLPGADQQSHHQRLLCRHRSPAPLARGRFQKTAELSRRREQLLAPGLLKRLGNHEIRSIHKAPDLRSCLNS